LLSSKLVAAGLIAFFLGGAGIVTTASAHNAVASTDNARTTEINQNTQTSSKADAKGYVDNGGSKSVTSTLTMTMPIQPAISISDYFSVPITSVMELHASGWGFGEIFKLYNYANLSGQTVESIQTMREVDHMGWGQIAKALDLHPGNQGDNLGGIVSGRNVVSDTVETDTTRRNNSHSNKPVKTNPGHNR
jgi:hypothetical protein